MRIILFKIKNLFNFICSKLVVSFVFIFVCFFKYFPVIRYANIITVLLFTYAFFTILYRLFFLKHAFINKYLVYGVIFIFSSLVSCIVNRALFYYENVKTIIIFILLFIIILPENKFDSKETILKNIYIICLLCSLLFTLNAIISLIYSYYTGNFSKPYSLNREHVYFSEMCLTGIGTSIYCLLYTKKNITKLLYMFSLIVLIATTIMIQQRNAYLALFVGIIIIILYCKYFKFNIFGILSKNINIVVFVFFVFLLIFVFSMYLKIYDPFLIIRKTATAGLNGRAEIYDIGFKTILNKNKVFFGSTNAILPIDRKDFIANNYGYWSNSEVNHLWIETTGSHSTILEQFFIHGLFGLLILICFYICIFTKYHLLFKYAMNDAGLKAFIIASSFCIFSPLVMSLFDRTLLFDFVFVQNTLFFVFVGALFRIYDLILKK